MTVTPTSTAARDSAAYHRFTIGVFDAVAVSDGTMSVPAYPTYAPNADPREVERTLRAHGLPADHYDLQGTALVVDTGAHRVLIDAGAGAELGPGLGRLAANLRAAGVDTGDIDTVILTHAHPDHIGGIAAEDGTLTFPNARYHIASVEWAFWTAPNVDLTPVRLDDALKARFVAAARRHLGAIAGRVALFAPDGEIVPGVRAVAAPGHTSGHSAVLIASGDARLLHVADVFHSAAFDLDHPDWQTAFDYDAGQAFTTRRRLLDEASADRMPLMAYHMPFPGLGRVRARADRYDWEPAF